MNEPLRALLLTLLLTLGGLAVALVATLVVARATGQLLERRARRRRDELRHLILTALLGEPDQAREALSALHAHQGRAWQRVERQAFAMLPKIKGDSRDALVDLLTGRGAAERAYDNLAARSPVRRSRGAHQLGALGEREALPLLVGLLTHPHFLVRRTAVRALGQIREPAAVAPLLDAVSADPAIARDVVAALQRIGPSAAASLREDLSLLVPTERWGRRGALAATTLGLHGDMASVPVLIEALERGHQPSMRAAAAEALGEIGLPAAVPALLRALEREHPDVRVDAALALGKISDAATASVLAAAFGSGDAALDRAIAKALLDLGPLGTLVLEGHPSYYAVEALAVHRMRASA